jgi:predicted ATPase/class 3 adenylate cyclase
VDNGRVLQRVLCESLVGRDEELSALEDALLTANRGESRFVLLAGEAGMGKTRLAGEVSRRARKLGCEVLWGSCSEAELSLPYLPLVEALGNYLTKRDVDEVRALLGGAATELGQLFPQLAEGPVAAGDPAQAKLRLFEATVALLALPAREQGILLVVEDVHWADSSTRELLDHLARRLTGMRAMVLCTYRSDELERRHPLVPTLQSWRRSGLAETIALEHLTPFGVAEMIADIFDSDEVGDDFRDLMTERTEGNPFVLEEMLREAIERGDVFRSADRWERRSLDEFEIPETVRDTILLRLGRMDDAHVEVLRAGAVLGRSFDYATLGAVVAEDEAAVDAALETALAQQLLEEDPGRLGAFRWRHALTQEAIYTDTVPPRRQRIHARAAEVVEEADGSPIELVGHLFGAGKGAEAVPACLRAADQAEGAVAFGAAVDLLERALPYIADEEEHASLLCRMGRLRWQNSEPAASLQLLEEGVTRLEALGKRVDAARARVVLGRCHWELLHADLALEEYERAREALEPEGPSAELALTYMRIAGLHTFQLEDEHAVQAATRAVEIAEAAGADFEREWSRAFLALGLFGVGQQQEALELMRAVHEDAFAKGYLQIAWNVTNNEGWLRVHCLIGGLDEVAERVGELPFHPFATGFLDHSLGTAALAQGNLETALEHARAGTAVFERIGHAKGEWRGRVLLAEALAELGETDEALRELPPASTRTELQDVVYDAAARIHTLLPAGSVDEAAAVASEVLARPELHSYRETTGVAVEAFVAAGRLDEARALVDASRAHGSRLGLFGVDEAEGRLLLAEGDAAGARPLLASAVEGAANEGFRLLAWRARTLLAQALAELGERDYATELLGEVARESAASGARRLRDEAVAAAGRLGLPVPTVGVAGPEPRGPELLTSGERLVTTLFADVRGYTELAAATAPEELADRIGTLQRWAAAEVGRRHGIVDKFAGDAVMATFNAAGARVDHAVHALEAALALRDKAALLDLPLGIGIAVGPAVVTRAVQGSNVSVLGVATNLSARLQAAAGGGEILLGEEAYRRVESWLQERGLGSEREVLELKGFAEPQVAHRIRAAATG